MGDSISTGPDPRSVDAGYLIQTASLLAAVGTSAFLVDRITAKAFRYARLAIEDERTYGRGVR